MKLRNIKTIGLMLLTASISISMASGVYAEDISEEKDSAGNVFVTDKTIDGGSYLSGFGAGRNVTFTNAEAEDSICLAGMNVKAEDCSVGGSVYMAGYNIDLSGVDIDGNIITAGNEITIDENTSSKGVIACGSVINFDGETDAMHVSGGKIIINGVINGDADIAAETVVFGENAEVKGTLNVSSKNEPSISSDKVGELKYEKVESSDVQEVQEKSAGSKILDEVKSAIYWVIAMCIVALIMCLLIPSRLDEAAIMVKVRTGAMLGSGAVTLFAFPIAAILVCITFIGLPLGFISIAVYALALALGVTFAGASLGRLVFPQLNPVLASICSVAILEVIRKIPYLGMLVSLAAAIYTLGFLIQILWNSRLRKLENAEVVADTE